MIGPPRRAYRAAVNEESPDPPIELYVRTRNVPERDEVLLRAVDAVISYRNEELDGPNAWNICGLACDTEQQHRDLMRMVIYLAKANPRYWGINDPENERYCSECREVYPNGHFETDAPVCRDCA